MVRNLLLLLILFTLFQEGCLRKQEHLVQEPLWPRYKVEGWVYDTTTLAPVEGVFVILEPIIFLFHDSMPPETLLTDSSGYFIFYSVPAMACTLKGYTEGYHGFKKRLVIFRDREIEIYIKPK